MTDILIFAGFFAFVGIFITAAIFAERARKRRIEKELTDAGLKVNFSPDKEDQAAAFAQVGRGWSGLRTGSTGVLWTASGAVGTTPVTLLEHRYTTGSGKNRSTHYHTIAAVAAPMHWPTVELAEEHIFHKIGEFFGSKDFKVEDEAFNKRWRIKTESEDFALLVLSPQVQAWTMSLPKGMQIRVGGGAVTIAVSRYLRSESAMMITRCVELSRMLPPELRGWG